MEDLRNIILTLSGLGALLGVYINFSSNFFTERIKTTFKNGPIKNSSVRVVISWIISLIMLIDIIAITIFFIGLTNSGVTLSEVSIWDSNNSLGENLTIIAFLISLLSPIIVWGKVKSAFTYKLINNKTKKIGKLFKVINLGGLVSSAFLSAIPAIMIGISIYEGIKIENNTIEFILTIDKETLIYSMIMIFINVTAFIVSFSLFEVIRSIGEKYQYILKGSKNISCINYLDYEDYYLVFNKGKETYIRKSDVKEILKINNNNKRKRHKNKFINKISNKLQINIKVKKIRYGNIVIWSKSKIIYNVVLYITNESEYLGIIIKEGVKPSKLNTSEVCKLKSILNLENKELDYENSTSRYKNFLRSKEYIVKIK